MSLLGGRARPLAVHVATACPNRDHLAQIVVGCRVEGSGAGRSALSGRLSDAQRAQQPASAASISA